MPENTSQTDVLGLTAQIVSAHVSNNSVTTEALPALIQEYGLENHILYDGRPLTDTELAMRYNACDATVLISGGEGFGYPIAESLACGTLPVIPDYSAGPELGAVRVPIAHTAIQSRFNMRRAHVMPEQLERFLHTTLLLSPERSMIAERVAHLDIARLSVVWKKWFLKGLTQ